MPELDRKRILLVHPLGYSAADAARDISRKANIMPPLGLASIAAYLEQKGISADIIDCFAHPDSDSKILRYVERHKPGFIGLSCSTSSFLDAVRIVTMVKKELPGIRSVFGGPHVSALREKILEDQPIIDYSVAGEGEEALEQLINQGGGEPAGIAGLVYRGEDGGVRFSGFRKRGIDLDSLPFPAYEKLEGYPEAYRLPIFNYPRTPNTSCISSRGCPYSCSYCDRSVFRRSFRYNSAGYLYRHLKHLKDRFNIRHINFYDDQFTFNRARVESLCRMLIEKPLGMTFNCAVRAEHVDLDLLKRMKAAGCWMVSLGIETGDGALLKQHRQNADLDMLANTIRDIKKAGLRVKGLLMMGLPGETEETVANSMKYVFSLPIDDFNLAKFTPFPGSPVYENIHRLGEFDEDPAKMDCMHFVFVPKGMTRQRLEELFILFYKSHFQRPRVLWGYVTMLWRSPDSWLRFLGNLTNFLKFARSNKRIERT
jgi:radical SAM superfamily enzyme YgiQ (UPF0313 family)